MAVPFGILVAIYTSEFAGPKIELRNPVRPRHHERGDRRGRRQGAVAGIS